MPRGKKGKGDDEEPEVKQKVEDKKDQKKSRRGKRGDSDEEEPTQVSNKNGPNKKGARDNSSDEEAPDNNKNSKKNNKTAKGNNKGAKGSDDEKEITKTTQASNKNAKGGKKQHSDDEDNTPKVKAAPQESDEEELGSKPAQKANKKKDKKKVAKQKLSDDEDKPKQKKGQTLAPVDSSDDEEESKPVQKQNKKNDKKKPAKQQESEDEESEEDGPSKPAAKNNKKKDRKKAGKGKPVDEGEDEDEDEEDGDIEEKKPAPQPAQKGKLNKKKGGKQQDSDDEPAPVQNKAPASDDEGESKPAKKSKKDAKKAGKRQDEAPAPSKKGKPAPTIDEDDSEEEEEEEEEALASQPAKKANKNKNKDKKKVPVKKQESEEDEDDDDDDEEEEEDTLASKPAKKANKKKEKKKAVIKKQESEDEEELEDDQEEEEEVEEAKPVQKGKNNKEVAKKEADKKAGNKKEDKKKDASKKSQGKTAPAKEEEENDDEDDQEELAEKLSNLKVAEDPEAKAKRIAERKQEKDKKKKEKKEKKIAKKAPKKDSEESKDQEEEEEELTEYEKYQRAQEMKGQEAPSFVHLRTSAAERNKIGNDIRMENFSLSVPGKTLLKEVNMTLAYGRRYGLVGRNGLGKSTLMAKIAEREGVQVANHLRILYVEQEVPGDATTPIDYVLRADKEREWLLSEEKELNRLDKEDPDWMDDPKKKRAYTIKDIFDRLREIESEKAIPRAAAILVGLGFPADEIKVKPSSEYSGGWRMRIALARALFSRPEILLLDEPTNHLDLHACVWLERYLSNWTNTLIVISHEATFLNEIVDGIIHIHDKTLTQYKGDYWAFSKARDQNQRAQEKSKDKQDKKVKEIKDFIQKNKTSTNAKQAASRKKLLEKMEDVKVDRDDPSLKVSFPDPDHLTPPLLQFKEASFGYDPKRPMFKNLDFSIDMDSRVALVGLNGVGKSTLMKLMYGELTETDGYIERSRKMRVARFTQHHMDLLDENVSAVGYLGKKYGVGDEHRLRQLLGRFGITGNLAMNKISTLSGGQKSRVVLADLAFAEPHILLLDEPSNHLDLDAIEALAQGLNAFKGGVVLISHNQRLISLVCNQIWVVTRKGTVEVFNGEFPEYKDAIIAEMDFE